MEAFAGHDRARAAQPSATIRHRVTVVFVASLPPALVYLLMVATTVALHGIVLLEKREIRERLGPAYEGYAERVPRYVPRRR